MVCVFLMDIAVGKILDSFIVDIPRGNETGLTEYAVKSVKDEVVVIGSSRGRHHYVTSILEDSLNMSAYNVSLENQFVSYQSCAIDAILNRYSPKLIIWEFGTDCLFSEHIDPVHKLHPYFHYSPMIKKTIIKKEGEAMRLKLMSNLYRYNNVALNIFIRHFTSNSSKEDKLKGYSPLKKELEGEDTIIDEKEMIGGTLDSVRIETFISTLEKIKQKGVNVVITDSPEYFRKNKKQDPRSEQTLKRLCQEYGITYLDNRFIEQFQHSPQFFHNRNHLNDKGAHEYTKYFTKQILNLFPEWSH